MRPILSSIVALLPCRSRRGWSGRKVDRARYWHRAAMAWSGISAVWLSAAALMAADAAPPPPPIRAEVEAALAKARPPAHAQPTAPAQAPPKFRIMLLADQKDHGPDEHDYPRWQERWSLLLGGRKAAQAEQVNLYGPALPSAELGAGLENLEIIRAQVWPTENQFAAADVLVAFCYLPWNEARKKQLETWLHRGGGLVLIHSATWTMPKADPAVAALVGVGGFTRYRHGPVRVEVTAADHPIGRGLPPQLAFFDETYWPPTPPLDTARVSVLAVAREEDAAGPGQLAPQPMFWVFQTGRGRVFGCVLGHYNWTFDDPWFRVLLLRGMAWAGDQPVDRLEPLVLRGARVAPPTATASPRP